MAALRARRRLIAHGGAPLATRRRGRAPSRRLDFLLQAMRGSALLCGSHPRRQGHGAGLHDAKLPDVGTHHFTVDVCGSSEDRRVFGNAAGACFTRHSAREHDHCKQHSTFHGTTPHATAPSNGATSFLNCQKIRARFSITCGQRRRQKLHRIIGEIAASIRCGNAAERFARFGDRTHGHGAGHAIGPRFVRTVCPLPVSPMQLPDKFVKETSFALVNKPTGEIIPVVV